MVWEYLGYIFIFWSRWHSPHRLVYMKPSLHDMLASGKFERFQLHGPRVFWSPNFLLERALFVRHCRMGSWFKNVGMCLSRHPETWYRKQFNRVNRPRTEPQRSIAKKDQRQCCFLPCRSFWVGAYRYKKKYYCNKYICKTANCYIYCKYIYMYRDCLYYNIYIYLVSNVKLCMRQIATIRVDVKQNAPWVESKQNYLPVEGNDRIPLNHYVSYTCELTISLQHSFGYSCNHHGALFL